MTRIVEDATLIVSELVTNAIEHSGGRTVELTLDHHDGYLRIRVHDGRPCLRPGAYKPGSNAEAGRGLWLVKSIAFARDGDWGVLNNGATFWCELAPEAS